LFPGIVAIRSPLCDAPCAKPFVLGSSDSGDVRDVLATTAGLMPRRGRGASAAAVPVPPNSFFSLIGTTFKTTGGFYPKPISLHEIL
jgi:hypothetical protein